ncbi:hypothetical protein DACRYDRAFT_75153 [Dacryopinax primogenitus]|uniref:G-patch domain-containing protein n=1 Tax=Dacryopinax primogenitus (strain DJM 731) TaxID=1858805 RepID=M5GEX2_DACPD|nr:uncharacterized protein DACRYDRAFT_75153 [Dacryopinax primogenitus]EJU05772.1 hypothetical protein DACRYDRAFT_75153 [Dacryopinax primogenitus]
MSYRNEHGGREWDQGKDWDREGYDSGPRGTRRAREDDWGYEGDDWKRRKMNDDDYAYEDYSGPSAHSGPRQGPPEWSGYQGHDGMGRGGGAGFGPPGLGANFNTPAAYGRGRGRGPSEASEHVIFLGLDPDFTEDDLKFFLIGQGLQVVNTTIIRDRNTGQSRSFGFAQFNTAAEASRFLTPNYPFVGLPPPASHAFGGVVNDTPGRRVKIDFSQSAQPKFREQAPPNDGSRDMGSQQTAVLLLRGLDPLTSIDEIEQALRNAAGEGKEGAEGMKRIALIRDRGTRMGWGFAFVEFKDVASAGAVLGYTMMPQLHPNGFRISDKPIAVAFAHTMSFQPLPPGTPKDEYCISSSLAMGGQEGWWTKYWDEGAGIGEKKFEVKEDPKQSKEDKEKKKKTKLKEVDESSLPAPTKLSMTEHAPLKISAKKPGASIAIVPKSGDAKSAAPAAVKIPVLGFGGEEETAQFEDAEDEEDTSAFVKVNKGTKFAPMAGSKKTLGNINKWNAKQEELATDAEQPAPAPAPAMAPVKRAPAAAVKATSTPTRNSPAAEADKFEYGDPVAFACFLCSRKFTSVDQLRRHDQESDLHKARDQANLKDEKLREVAQKKADTARAKHQEDQAPKYRDRASERREIYGQPDVPPPDALNTSTSGKKRRASSPSPPPPPVALGKDENNIGNKLLKKMGWAEGTGLGTEGEGIVDPIETALYASGVGLGATKPQPVGKYEPGIRGYVAKAKDSARERYNQ